MQKKKKLVWTPLALNDRTELFYSFNDRDEALFSDETIDEATRSLAASAESDTPGRIDGTFEKKLSEQSVLVYDVKDKTVRILRILSTGV